MMREIGAPERQDLQAREVIERLRTAYYDLRDEVANLPSEKAGDILVTWINNLTLATGPLMRTSSRRFLAADLKGLVEVNKALPEGETQQEEDYYHEPRGTASQHEAGKSYILGQF